MACPSPSNRSLPTVATAEAAASLAGEAKVNEGNNVVLQYSPGTTRRVGQRRRRGSAPHGEQMTDNRRGGTPWETKAARRISTRVRNR